LRSSKEAMKAFSSSVRGSKAVGIMVVASLLPGLLCSFSASAQSSVPTNAQPAAAAPTSSGTVNPPAAMSVEERQKREAWHKRMLAVPLPKKGCFRGVYPNMEWQEIPCVATPSYPQPPRHGPRPLVVGDKNDVSAHAPTGFISQATGSFPTANVTGESGPIANSGPSVANAYTIQMNTNLLPANVSCTGSPNPNCSGWEQFVFENDGSSARAFIQYWLIKYNTTCPANANWNQFSFVGQPNIIYCWKDDSMGAVPVTPAQPITNLGNLSLTATVGAGGDSVTLFDASSGMMYPVTGDDALDAEAGWQTAEFNVFGDAGDTSGGSRASFKSGTTIVPRTEITYGSTVPPICSAQGFTGETNNLSFGPGAPAPSPPGPAILFTESSTGGAPSNCVAATAVGDTHLTTVNGLHYDFQASGDFVLAETGPGFIVQNRQATGAPTWPNAAVNKAVATKMGRTNVAICVAPTRLMIDGRSSTIADGTSRALPDGITLSRSGNVYFIQNDNGDSVRAQLNHNAQPPNDWIDVSVGLGSSSETPKVRGLLGNPNGNVNEIALADGVVLKEPVSFEVLYQRYGASWRVPSGQSLLCKDQKINPGIPAKPFYANDLNRDQSERAREICTKAGVKERSALEDCMLDVTVLGTVSAANVFVHAPPPVAVRQAGSRGSH
jgi:hypothetical protein